MAADRHPSTLPARMAMPRQTFPGPQRSSPPRYDPTPGTRPPVYPLVSPHRRRAAWAPQVQAYLLRKGADERATCVYGYAPYQGLAPGTGLELG